MYAMQLRKNAGALDSFIVRDFDYLAPNRLRMILDNHYSIRLD